MAFNETERAGLLALKGVGATVIARLEQLGFSSLAQLREQNPAALTLQISQMLGSTCWHNSPQARAAITAVVDWARAQSQDDAGS